MNTETINEMTQMLTQIDSCTLCDNENLRVDIYNINEDENAFKIACSLCQEELEYFFCFEDLSTDTSPSLLLGSLGLIFLLAFLTIVLNNKGNKSRLIKRTE